MYEDIQYGDRSNMANCGTNNIQLAKMYKTKTHWIN